MHWEYFVKNKGKAERYKKRKQGQKLPGHVKYKKMEGADGEICTCIITQTRYVKGRECRCEELLGTNKKLNQIAREYRQYLEVFSCDGTKQA